MSTLEFFLGSLALLAIVVRSNAAGSAEDNEAAAKQFIARYEATVKPLEIEVARRWWNANLTGKDDDYRLKQEAETRLELQLSDPKTFAELKTIHEGQPRDLGHRARDPRPLFGALGPSGRSGIAQGDAGQVEQDRAGVQRVSAQGGRQRAQRQPNPPRPSHIDRLGRAEGRVGSEQGSRPRGRGRFEGIDRAAQSGCQEAWLQGFSRHAARPRRTEPRASAQAFRRVGCPKPARPFHAAKGELDAVLRRIAA